MLSASRLSGIEVGETPAPGRLAPYSFALSASVDNPQGPEVSGRLILLHDPAGHPSWEGTLRLVTYVAIDDPRGPAHETLWSGLLDGLDAAEASYLAPGGTVTVSSSTGYGALRRGGDPEVTVELRASWTPHGDVGAHVSAWCAVLGRLAEH
jgi:hypothetical protein